MKASNQLFSTKTHPFGLRINALTVANWVSDSSAITSTHVLNSSKGDLNFTFAKKTPFERSAVASANLYPSK